TVENDWFRQRLTLVLLCVVAAFSVLFVRLFYLQVVEGEEYRRLSENNCIRLQAIDAPRGLIYDRDGKLLVDNRPAFDLSIVPKDAKPVSQTVSKLSSFLGTDGAEMFDALQKNRNRASYVPVVLRHDISRNALAAVEVHRYLLPGVQVDVKPRRQYIEPGSAAHLLGYLSEISPEELTCGDYPDCRSGDTIGKFGVEKSYQSLLQGKRGGRQVEVDARGRVVRVLQTVDAHPGLNLYLTIDSGLQKKAEELLRGKAGAVVALDPRTGRVLALASSPSFDQNIFVDGMSDDQWKSLVENPYRPMENKAIQALYPPASTYKIITALAGLEEGVIDANTTFFCPGYHTFGNRVYRCWKRGGHGHMNVVSAIEQSCDVFFYQVGQKLGIDRLAWYAKACGLGSVTGIELDNEEPGLVPTAAWKRKKTGIPWQGGETLSVAIGQGYNLVTPLQMAVAISAIANGGARYQPMVLHHARKADGDVVQRREPRIVGRLPVSEQTLALVQNGLWRVVNGDRGTARRIRLKNVDIAGKTGTAQVFSRKKSEDNTKTPDAEHLKPHAWFVAYAPAENPEIAVSVLIEHGEHGSSAAAPVAGELIRYFLAPKAEGEALLAGTGSEEEQKQE
ncbi:MAG: penicillin-binding protein 2, partial [Desulfobacteraceae bacterium]|nr:penicillin-binding protein 2 [Desulfobacteraceae bacterium]